MGQGRLGLGTSKDRILPGMRLGLRSALGEHMSKDNSVIDGNQKYLVGTQGEIARKTEQEQRDCRASQFTHELGVKPLPACGGFSLPKAGVPHLDEKLPELSVTGRFQVRRQDTGEILYEDDNVITNTVKWLFAYLMANYNPGEAFTPQQPYPQGQG